MVFHVTDFYLKLISIRNTIIQDLMKMKEFQIGKNKSLAKKGDKNVYQLIIIVSFLTTLAYMMFHPMIGDYHHHPSFYILERAGKYKVVVHCIIFFQMIFIIYAQLMALYGPFCVSWGQRTHYFRLKEYVETNLCKKYNYNVIDSKHEQDIIYYHLKMCTKFHLLMKR